MVMFAISKKSLIVYHIVAHLVVIWALFNGSWLLWLASFVLYILFATIGGTITYHRLLSHRSFKSPKWFEYTGSIMGALGGNGSGLAWAAIHREHHRFTDTEKDPHAPEYKGFFRVQFLSMLDEPNIKYVPDLLRSKFHLFIHKQYWLVNLIYIAICFALLGWDGIIFGYFVPTLMVWHAGSAINTVNHKLGYRNYVTKDWSTNNFVTGYLVSGEGWHNNHHAQPANPRFGHNPWEFDLGYLIIQAVRQD
jgi:stearoyl-CoA desaturase (delta-9 desaturase)